MSKIIGLITFFITLSIWTEAAFKDFVIEQKTDLDHIGCNDDEIEQGPSNSIIESDNIDNPGLLTLNELMQGSMDSNMLMKVLKNYIENMHGIEEMTVMAADTSEVINDWQNSLSGCSDDNDLYVQEPGTWSDIFF